MGEGSRMIRRLPIGFRKKCRHKARGMQKGLSKASWLQRLLVMHEGEPFKEILAQPSLGAGQPVEVSQVVIHLLDEFHLLV